jgi:hypothetical protein
MFLDVVLLSLTQPKTYMLMSLALIARPELRIRLQDKARDSLSFSIFYYQDKN